MQGFLLVPNKFYVLLQLLILTCELPTVAAERIFRPVPCGDFLAHEPDLLPYFPWEVITARNFPSAFTQSPVPGALFGLLDP